MILVPCSTKVGYWSLMPDWKGNRTHTPGESRENSLAASFTTACAPHAAQYPSSAEN
jgi:hypothetical protein